MRTRTASDTNGDNTQAGSVENERGRERMSEGSGRAEVERRIIQRSIEDESFRQRLLEDPKAAVEQELGTRLPEGVRVVTVEETPDTIYLVLPSTPMAGGESGALSDQQLESVAGGWATFQMTCGNDCYPTGPGMFGC
jgi:Nitrile hydratase, alpha chain